MHEIDKARMRAIHEAIVKQLVDEGKIIEGGWQSLRMLTLSPNATPLQLEEMRRAFFAGAQHLFASMMNMLDAGNDATDDDMRRMILIDSELAAFREEIVKSARKEREGTPQ